MYNTFGFEISMLQNAAFLAVIETMFSMTIGLICLDNQAFFLGI